MIIYWLFPVFLLMGVILESSVSANDKDSKKVAQIIKTPAEICEVNIKESFLEKCRGKQVKIMGVISKTILQHPNYHYPDTTSTGLFLYKHTSHIDTQWGQLGLISEKPINCQKAIEVEGILRFAQERQNSDKTNPYIQVFDFYCK